jgi:hypothetical protein
MNYRSTLAATLLLAIACATNVAKPGDPAAVAEVQLVNISPVPGAELTTKTVLVAEIKYAIQNYKPPVDYYVAPVFASTDGAGMTFNMSDRISDSQRIVSPQGTVTVRYPVARELGSPQLAQPVKLWFFVMERIGAGKTRIIGRAGPLEFRTAAGS